MAKRPRRKLTEQELKNLEGWAALKMPVGQIAVLLGLSDTWFDQLLKTDDAAQLAYSMGQAKGTLSFRKALYEKAVVEKDVQALKFWGATQEGMTSTERVELTGANGSPLHALSDAELDAKIDRLVRRTSLTE